MLVNPKVPPSNLQHASPNDSGWCYAVVLLQSEILLTELMLSSHLPLGKVNSVREDFLLDKCSVLHSELLRNESMRE